MERNERRRSRVRENGRKTKMKAVDAEGREGKGSG